MTDMTCGTNQDPNELEMPSADPTPENDEAVTSSEHNAKQTAPSPDGKTTPPRNDDAAMPDDSPVEAPGGPQGDEASQAPPRPETGLESPQQGSEAMTDDQWQGYCRRYRETLKECALYYIDRGWAVLPLYGIGRDGNCACGNPDCDSPGKHPYTPLAPRGVKNATTLAKDVERWFRDTEGSLEPLNIGIAAGAASKLAILDVDPGHGGEVSLKKYDVPKTLIVNTGGGGTHYYFKHPGGDVRNSAGKLGPGLDVRGSNGYVAAPPSRHRSGKQYKFAPNDRGIADPRGDRKSVV